MLKMFDWIESLDSEMISLVIPTYNRSTFLEGLLQSILNQIDSPKYECIVVDDGSTEIYSRLNTEVCSVYRDLGIKVTYIKLEENSGTVSIPRNIGISHINGGIIAPTDDDCFLEPIKLNCLYKAITSLNMMWTPLAYGNRKESQKENGVFKYIKTVNSRYQNPEAVGLDNGQFIYDASVYNYIDPVFAINACDWETYKQIANLGKFVFVNESVCNYIWHDSNISMKLTKPYRVNPLSVLHKFKDYFKDGPFKEKAFKQNE